MSNENKADNKAAIEGFPENAKTITLADLYRTVLEKVYGEEIRIWKMMCKVNKESGMGPTPKSSMLQLIENVLENNPSPVQGMSEFISHPLDTVIENCIHVNISFKDMCLCLGLNDEGLREFLAERMPINDKIATGLEKLLGVDKQFWLNRQNNFNKRLINE